MKLLSFNATKEHFKELKVAFANIFLSPAASEGG
jgi:hypothetical protein